MEIKRLIFLSVFISLTAIAEEQIPNLSCLLPPGAQALSPSRFKRTKSFDETVKEIKKRCTNALRQKPAVETINLPHVRACTLLLPDSKDGIESINIYLNIQTGFTYFNFVGPST